MASIEAKINAAAAANEDDDTNIGEQATTSVKLMDVS